MVMETLNRINKVLIKLFHKPTCVVNKFIYISSLTSFRVNNLCKSCARQIDSSSGQQFLPITELNHGICHLCDSKCPNRKNFKKSISCRTLKSSSRLSNDRKDPVMTNRYCSLLQKQSYNDTSYLDAKDSQLCEILSKDMIVKADFLNEKEEASLLFEVDKHMRRLRYEFDHWDNAIHGYRETEKKEWTDGNVKILNRVKDLAFTSNVAPLAYVHVLDIAKEGHIKPHIDSVRFCGDTITGMCLLSSCVMRLALENDSTKFADVYLPRRSLYIMRGRARYDFTHEVLKDELSYFKGQHILRGRRISIICRNEPSETSNL